MRVMGKLKPRSWTWGFPVLAQVIDVYILTSFVFYFLVLLLTFVLIWLNRQYRNEAQQLEQGALEASEMPVLRHHVVLVFVDRLDLATAGDHDPGQEGDDDAHGGGSARPS